MNEKKSNNSRLETEQEDVDHHQQQQQSDVGSASNEENDATFPIQTAQGYGHDAEHDAISSDADNHFPLLDSSLGAPSNDGIIDHNNIRDYYDDHFRHNYEDDDEESKSQSSYQRGRRRPIHHHMDNTSLGNLPDIGTANNTNGTRSTGTRTSPDIIVSNSNNNNNNSVHSSIQPGPAPPQPSEQTAREQLIERERQGRLERERARLKQQLALSRERDEEDEAYAEFDRVRERIASIDNNSLDDMDLTDAEESEEENLHQSYHGEQSIVVSDDPNQNSIHDIGDIGDIGGADVDDQIVPAVPDTQIGIGIVPVPAPAHVPINSLIAEIVLDDIPMSQTMQETHVNDNEMIAIDDEDNVRVGTTNNRGNSIAASVNASANANAPSPLGFTMERFLQDGVMVPSSSNDIRTSGGSVAGGVDASNNSSAESALTRGAEIGHHDVRDQATDNDSNTNHQLVDLISEGSNTTTGIADMSVTVGAVHSCELVLSPPLSRIRSSDASESSIVGGAGGISSSRNEREYSFNDNAPRLARLTEAEILELAEIDYASVGNMPPRSERDEQHLPSIHDLSGLGRMSNTSDQTHTTMVESMSMASADIEISQSETNSRSSHFTGRAHGYAHSPDINTSLLSAPSVSNSSPPFAAVASLEQIDDLTLHMVMDNSSNENNEYACKLPAEENEKVAPKLSDGDLKPPARELSTIGCRVNLENGGVEMLNEKNASNDTYTLPNRIIRPGLGSGSKPARPSNSLHRRSQTSPNIPSYVDGFDYSKYKDPSPQNDLERGENLETDTFSRISIHPNQSSFIDYGSTILQHDNGQGLHIKPPCPGGEGEGGNEEHHPLLGMKRNRQESIEDMVASIFSSVRSLSTEDIEADINDCDKYLSSNVLERAFPERFVALIVTLVIEIPVLLMISGGSSQLCALIGRSKYQLLIAFLPLSSAISGNCGLQASTFATRAITHLHVTKQNYLSWLWTELKVAALLGVGMGVVVGGIAYQASGFDFAFGFTIFFANFISVLTAGLTGTTAPLLSTFIFHRDSGKWGGLIETALQDVVSSFVMVVLSYKVLLWFGSTDIDPSDKCGN